MLMSHSRLIAIESYLNISISHIVSHSVIMMQPATHPCGCFVLLPPASASTSALLLLKSQFFRAAFFLRSLSNSIFASSYNFLKS